MRRGDAIPCPTGPQAGFTLVEVLAALALTALILVSLNLAMTGIRKGVDAARGSLGGSAALSSAAGIFAGDVARIAKIRRKGSDKAQGYVFDGKPDVMVYPLTETEGLGRPGLYLVRLRVTEGANGAQLIRDRAPLLAGEPWNAAPEWRDPVLLLDGRFDVAFAYRAQRGGERSWADIWSGQRAMPEEIRLTVTDRKTGRLAMPVLVQPLRVDGEVECASEGPRCIPADAAGQQP